MRQNQAPHAATTDEPVIPTEIMIQNHVEFGRLTSFQSRKRTRVDLGFETATPKRPGHLAVGKKNGLGTAALRTGAFGAGNERERERSDRCSGKLFVETDHAKVL